MQHSDCNSPSGDMLSPFNNASMGITVFKHPCSTDLMKAGNTHNEYLENTANVLIESSCLFLWPTVRPGKDASAAARKTQSYVTFVMQKFSVIVQGWKPVPQSVYLRSRSTGKKRKVTTKHSASFCRCMGRIS